MLVFTLAAFVDMFCLILVCSVCPMCVIIYCMLLLAAHNMLQKQLAARENQRGKPD